MSILKKKKHGDHIDQIRMGMRQIIILHSRLRHGTTGPRHSWPWTSPRPAPISWAHHDVVVHSGELNYDWLSSFTQILIVWMNSCDMEIFKQLASELSAPLSKRYRNKNTKWNWKRKKNMRRKTYEWILTSKSKKENMISVWRFDSKSRIGRKVQGQQMPFLSTMQMSLSGQVDRCFQLAFSHAPMECPADVLGGYSRVVSIYSQTVAKKQWKKLTNKNNRARNIGKQDKQTWLENWSTWVMSKSTSIYTLAENGFSETTSNKRESVTN